MRAWESARARARVEAFLRSVEALAPLRKSRTAARPGHRRSHGRCHPGSWLPRRLLLLLRRGRHSRPPPAPGRGAPTAHAPSAGAPPGAPARARGAANWSLEATGTGGSGCQAAPHQRGHPGLTSDTNRACRRGPRGPARQPIGASLRWPRPPRPGTSCPALAPQPIGASLRVAPPTAPTHVKSGTRRAGCWVLIGWDGRPGARRSP